MVPERTGRYRWIKIEPKGCAASRPFFQKPAPVFSRIKSRLFLHISAEIGNGRKIQPACNIGQGEIFETEQPGYFLEGKTVDPIGCGVAARFLAYFGQIVRCDTESRCVVGQVPVPDILFLIK